MAFLSIFTRQHQDGPFDLLPDDVIRIIFNKIQDAKILLASFSLNKRLAEIIPQTTVISLSLNIPRKKNDNDSENYNRRRRNNGKYTYGNFVNIAKSAANYLITKLLRRSNNNSNNCCDEDPIVVLRQRLRSFNQIKHLHLELHNDTLETYYELFKWKADYNREFKNCHMLFCDLSFRHFSAGEWLPEQEHGRWSYGHDCLLSSCMNAASKRHQMVKEMLPLFPTVETVMITDAMRQGRLSMAERDVRDLRESLKEERVVEGQKSRSATRRWCAMRRWQAQLLELPSLRCTWKDAMMLVVDPVVHDGNSWSAPRVDPVNGNPPMVPVVKVDGGGDSYECNAEERAMFEEAQREILITSHGVKHTWEWVRRDL